MKFIKSFSTELRPSLKYKLHERLATYNEARCHKTLHASDMTKTDPDFCPREFALLDATKGKKKGEFLGTALQCTFDLGEAMHDLLRETWGLPVTVGTWECLACGKKYTFSKHPGTCTVEGCSNFKYHEETFFSQSTGAVGNMDMLVDLGEPKLRVCEIKSIDKDKFKTLVAPLAEHRLRTNLYMRMIEDSNHPNKGEINTKEGLVFYICKGYGYKDTTLKDKGLKDTPFSPFKEFWVDRDDSATQNIWDLAIGLQEFREGNGKMAEGICPNGLVKRAQCCSMVKHCWSGNFPSSV